jgi:D-arabinose 1-dehydrogenase-like Zn-dependent alcohol dehydrogenase
MAKALGTARVVAAAGSVDKADFARQCGADEVVTYSQPSWGDLVDLVLDGVGGELSILAPHHQEHFDYGLHLIVNGIRADTERP